MSIWSKIREYIQELKEHGVFTHLFIRTPEESVTFTIAIIALSAKMAKADGQVTRDEVRVLRQVFDFHERDEEDIGRVFDLAREDVAGFDDYAKTIYKLFKNRPDFLHDIFESLFQIALADGEFHKNEEYFLAQVAEIFHLPKGEFEKMTMQYFPSKSCDIFALLDIPPGSSNEEIKAAYRQVVRNNHPDQLRARGLPSEAVNLAERRLQSLNEAMKLMGLA